MNSRSRFRDMIERYWDDTPVADRLREKERAEEVVFFRRHDRELIDKMRTADDEERRAYVRELTHMRCPECAHPLQTVEHSGVRVEECPLHHGMWLTDAERRTIAERERHSWISRYLYRSDRRTEERRPLI